ncbi:Fic family protein [Gordonia alkaliphila]|uniref:Fic family protein n=1 Tax=Gordonia alkaliphila TaxID=1053547 RepID=A0ABP8ZC40_9ACTN
MTSPDGSTWPSVDLEQVDWNPTVPSELLTRAQRARYRGPYLAAAVAPIADRTPYLTPELHSLVDDASTLITRFDAELGAELAPFATVLLRSEAAASSQIENLSSGAKQIALAELGSREKRNATEIVGNVAAMRAALALADNLDADAILSMHNALMAHHAPDIAGRWRAEAVWIGGSSIGPHDADYVAPQAAHVPDLIHDLIHFTRRTDLPALAQIALAHAQFETIHPFPDGNGRTGRALLQAMLMALGLTRNVTVPVSAGLLTDTDGYFRALDSYRHGDITPIIEAVATAAQTAVVNGSRLVADIRAIRTDWDSRVKLRADARARDLMEVLVRQPVVDGASAAEALGISPANAARAIGPLVDAGILREFTGFRRNRMWCATDITDALDDFARRALRKSP